MIAKVREIMSDAGAENREDLEVYFEKISEKSRKIAELGERVLADLNEEDEIANEIEDADAKDHECKKCLKGLARMMINDQDERTSTAPSTSKTHNVKLPKIDIKPYHGEPKGWRTFWENFINIIDDSDISHVQKFTYLRSYLGGRRNGPLKVWSRRLRTTMLQSSYCLSVSVIPRLL